MKRFALPLLILLGVTAHTAPVKDGLAAFTDGSSSIWTALFPPTNAASSV